MKILKFFSYLVFFSNILNCSSQSTNYIAITFDDLPAQDDYSPQKNDSSEQQAEVNRYILGALEKFNAPATGFVNESKLFKGTQEDSKKRTALLKMWVNRGFDLGNHTYWHKSFGRTPLHEFKKEIIDGAKVSKPLMAAANRTYKYFRHPYLHTALTPEANEGLEKFLGEQGYVVSPITIDTDDWVFNHKLLDHMDYKDKIIDHYLEHTRLKFKFYEDASNTMFGRNIKHVWLLHVNLLNSLCMEKLLQILKEQNYQFITIDEAMQDEAYKSPDNYYEPYGVSWLYRWDFSRGTKSVDWKKDPEPNFDYLTKSLSS